MLRRARHKLSGRNYIIIQSKISSINKSIKKRKKNIMWAIVKDGSVQQVFNNPRSVTIDGVLHPPGIFGTGWTNAERKAIGIYNYVEVNTRYDNRFYTQGSKRESINNCE